MPGSEHRVSQQYQPGSDRLVDGVATLGNRRHVAQHMRPAQLALGAVDEAVSRILVGHQHPIKLTAQQPLRCLLTAAKRRHEADRDLAQGQPHPASLTAPLVPGFIGMDDGGRLHLLFDGLVGRGEHGADPALRFTDGASAKAQTEVLLELLLYLADALVELTTLQSDIAQQISPHLAVAHRIGQGCFTGGDAPTAGAPIQLMLCHHIADLGQVKHLMNPVGLVMGHHLLTTAGALPGRIVWYCRQSVVLRMTFTPLPLVARLGTTSLAGSGALARRRGPRAISGGGLGGVIAVLVEAVFKLGDARHQLVNQLVGLLEGQRQAGWWRNGFAHDVMVPSWRDQARGNSGSRDDRLTFSCQCHLGEQLPIQGMDKLNVLEKPAAKIQQTVVLQGEVLFPGTYTVRQGETLAELLKRAGGLTEFANPRGAIFTREALRLQEQKLLNQYAADMRAETAKKTFRADTNLSSVISDPAKTLAFVEEASRSKALGRMVVQLSRIMRDEPGADFMLEDGDFLFVPTFRNTISIMGEVQVPVTYLLDSGLNVDDYLNKAGGVKKQADADRIFVVRADGSVYKSNSGYWFGNNKEKLQAGDTIVVPIDTDYRDALSTWTAATQILYQTGVAINALK
nr:OtnA protein [Vibrio cholerae]BCN20781.1 hypothetical protein [Vibrio cholerae]